MRQLFLYMSMSTDGFIAGPNNELDWMQRRLDQELYDDVIALVSMADTGITGYPYAVETIPFWLKMEKDTNASPADRALAQVLNRLHNVVLSNSEEKLTLDNSELRMANSDQDLIEAVTNLKQQSGKLITLPGGVRTAQKLTRLGLVDDYVLMVHPVALGTGKALFTTKTNLELVSSKMYGSGVVRLRYRCRDAASV